MPSSVSKFSQNSQTSQNSPQSLIEQAPMTPSLRKLARRGLVRAYAKGAQIISEGDLGDTLYIVLSGRLRIYSADPAREREITFGIYQPGEYVGEMGLDGGPRSANVVTLEKCWLAVVTRATLEQHLIEDPAFAFELLNKVIRRARAATMGLRQIALNDVYGRLKAVLEDLAVAQPDGTALIAEMPTHRDLAQRVGCTREMVSRVMKALVEGGWLKAVSAVTAVTAVSAAAVMLPRPLPARW